MRTALLAFTVLVFFVGSPARSQTVTPPVAADAEAIAETQTMAEPQAPTPLPAVETMSCDQIQAEMVVVGQQMNAQMDPNMATEAQAMMNEAQQRQRGAVAQSIGMGAMCMIPGLGMACMAAQQAQAAQMQREATANQTRMQAQIDRMNASMAGIDQERMTAISNRWEAESCQGTQAQMPMGDPMAQTPRQ